MFFDSVYINCVNYFYVTFVFVTLKILSKPVLQAPVDSTVFHIIYPRFLGTNSFPFNYYELFQIPEY